MKHTNVGDVCPSCEQKLLEACEEMADWFQEHVKPKYQDAHISWTYRDKTNQNQAFAEGKSKLPYPLSKHNKCDDAGNPCSLAIDLFRLCSNGMASWEWRFFKQISEDVKQLSLPIKWGGDFKTIGDADHFELSK